MIKINAKDRLILFIVTHNVSGSNYSHSQANINIKLICKFKINLFLALIFNIKLLFYMDSVQVCSLNYSVTYEHRTKLVTYDKTPKLVVIFQPLIDAKLINRVNQ